MSWNIGALWGAWRVPEVSARPEKLRGENLEAVQAFRHYLRLHGDEYQRLREVGCEVLEAPDPSYNCIAASIRSREGRMDRGSMVDQLERFYQRQGFGKPRRPSEWSYRLQPGVEKVVLFGKRGGDMVGQERDVFAVGKPTGPHPRVRMGLHAIVQEPDGSWLSKMGANCLIRIRHPLDVAGKAFGNPIAVFERPRQQPGI